MSIHMVEFTSPEAVPADLWRWPNFTPAELACKGTGRVQINTEALDKLQALRDELGAPLVINSAYRSSQHNKAVGGAKRSYHLLSRAFDVSMSGLDPVEFEEAARKVGFTGFGFYPGRFIHVDDGPEREWGERWTVDADPVPERAERRPGRRIDIFGRVGRGGFFQRFRAN